MLWGWQHTEGQLRENRACVCVLEGWQLGDVHPRARADMLVLTREPRQGPTMEPLCSVRLPGSVRCATRASHTRLGPDWVGSREERSTGLEDRHLRE